MSTYTSDIQYKEEIMKREGIKNEREIQVRTILGEIRKQKGFALIGARTPGTFSQDIKKIVAKLKFYYKIVLFVGFKTPLHNC